jgi:hypothetical protein
MVSSQARSPTAWQGLISCAPLVIAGEFGQYLLTLTRIPYLFLRMIPEEVGAFHLFITKLRLAL